VGGALFMATARGLPVWRRTRQRARWLARLRTSGALGNLARASLAAVPDLRTRAREPLPDAARFVTRRDADWVAGRVVSVHGWRLAESEAALFLQLAGPGE
jgi:hypothetical protein